MNNQKKKLPLNTKDERVKELSHQYGLSKKTVAYIRAALNGNKYTKESLIEHIEIENISRAQAIGRHRDNKEISEKERERLIGATTTNIEFREAVVLVLKELDEERLKDLLT